MLTKYFSSINYITLVLISVLIFFTLNSCESCQNSSGASSNPIQFYNIVVLLDLSDRIKNPNQIKRDHAIIKNLLELFSNRQAAVGYQSLDEFSINIAFQKGSTLDISDLTDALKITMDFSLNRDKFEEEKESFLLAIDELYKRALNSPMTGSDIWTFFRDYMGLMIKHPDEANNINFQNKCIILTDGYLQFNRGTHRQRGTYMKKSNISKMRRNMNWEKIFDKNNYGLHPIDGINFANLQVSMLEIDPINPVENTNEFPMLKLYWTDWFNKMGIQSSVYPKEANVENLKSKLVNFLKKNI